MRDNSENRLAVGGVDWVAVLAYVLLVLMGWLNIYAAVYDDAHASIFDVGQRYGMQLVWIGASAFIAVSILLIDDKYYHVLAYPLYWIMILVLVGVLLFGKEVNGAKAWIMLGPVAIQPTEFAKFTTALALARYMSSYTFDIHRFGDLLRVGAILGLPVAIVMLQNDTGSALVYGSFLFMLFREGFNGWVYVALFLVISLFVLSFLLEPTMLLIVLILVCVAGEAATNGLWRSKAIYLAGLALGAFARTAYVFPDDKGKKENVTILIRNAKIDPSDGKSGNPLILVDGREVRSIDSLSPDRIASISVLKDAASEAQYGEKGRDGVIIVTTKEGGADPQMQTFTYGGNSSSTAVVVRGAGTEPDSLAGRVRTMTYRIDGRRDSLGGDMVWKINGRDVDAGDLEELSGNVRSIRITKDAAVQGEDSAAAEGMMRIMTGQTMQAADAGLKAAEARMQAARAGLDAARRYMSAEEWKQAQKQLETAQKQLDEARAQAKSEISFSEAIAVDMQDSSADTADGGAVVAGAVGGTASETPSYWRVTTGEGTTRVDHSKTESGKTVFTGRVTLHNPSEIPDNYVIFINGEQASKADVLRLAPQKIKRMEVLRGKEAAKEYGAGSEGVIKITTRR